MPIRINLLAEQQAAEEARRKDPVKRALWMGSVLVFATVVWTLTLHAQVKAKRAELANLNTDFASVDERAKVVRNMQAEAGQFERRSVALDKYSTNRVLWGSMLDSFQKATMDQIRVKSLTINQRYWTNAATNFFSTNMIVPFTGDAPFWKFWASKSAATPVTSIVSNSFKSFTNSPPFSTNKLAYKVKVDVESTNLIGKTMVVKAEFTLPAVDIEDIDLSIAAGDYGNPPGGSVDTFLRNLVAIPYFAERLKVGADNRPWFVERPPNAQPDMSDPNNTMFLPFTAKLKFEERVLTNE